MFLSQNNNNDGNKEQEETFGSAGYVDVIECGNCFMNVYYLQTHQVVQIKYIQLFSMSVIPQ